MMTPEQAFGQMIQMTEENELLFPEGTYILCKAPLPHAEVDNIRKILREGVTAQELAACFASVSNQAAWTEDDVYDYEAGTEDYRKACEITDKWSALAYDLEIILLAMARDNGLLPEGKMGLQKKLEPLMNSLGFIDGRGWWIPDKKTRPGLKPDLNSLPRTQPPGYVHPAGNLLS